MRTWPTSSILHPGIRILILAIVLTGWIDLRALAETEPLTSQQQRDILAEAAQSYDRGIGLVRANPSEAHVQFQAAAQRFQLVVDSGVRNGPLFYNLANAYLQSGDIGRAILQYRRAEKLIPGDARLQSNLAFARTLCKSPIAPSGGRALGHALLWWHDHTALRTRFTIFIGAYMVCWLALLVRLWRPSTLWMALAVTGGGAALALGLSVALDVFGLGHRPAGVILADNVTVRKGNGVGFEPQFAQTLSPGVEFTLVERRGDWLDIELPNEATGWIEANQADLIP